ncbi:MAG: LptF/LptG family permease, partial [Terriglobales bacterium]
MKTGDRYLIHEALIYFAAGLLVFTFVIFMREAGRLLDLLARGSSWSLLLALLYALPATLVFTLPMAALVGILIALGRMAADRELMAFRAIGRSGWQLARPLLGFSMAVTAVALAFSLWIAPAGARALLRLEARLRNSQVVLAVRPRVFLETIPHAVVYIGDIAPGGRVWRQVFVADMSDANAPQITLARRGMLAAIGPNEVQLHLEDGTSYSVAQGRPDLSSASSFRSSDLPLRLPAAQVDTHTLPALPTRALMAGAERGRRAAQIELNRRWALALACLALALLGIPLGLRMRAGGKAAGLVTTLLLVLGYYLVLITGMALAHQGRAAPAVGAWAADAICAALGLWLLSGMDRLPRSAAAARDPAARLRA